MTTDPYASIARPVVFGPGNTDVAGAAPPPAEAGGYNALNMAGLINKDDALGAPTNPFGAAAGAAVPVGSHYVAADGSLTQQQPDYSSIAAPPGLAPPTQTSIPLGFMKGLEKPLDKGAGWLEGGVTKAGIATDDLLDRMGISSKAVNNALGMPSGRQLQGAQLAEGADANQAAYLDKMRAQGVLPNKAAEFAGNVVGTLPVAVENPWAAGAMSGALLGDGKGAAGVATDALAGAVGSKVGGMALNAVGKVVSPYVRPAVQTLIDAGVKLTPGQIMGGMAKGAEDKFTSLPFVGDVVKAAQNRSTDSFNRAAVNRALAPIGQELPSTVSTGHEAVAYAGDQIGKAYDSVLPHVQMTADPTFASDLASLHDDISTLVPQKADQLASIMNTNVFSKFEPGSTIDGQTFKDIDTKLGQIASRHSSSPDPDNQQFGDIVRSIQGTLRDTLARQNPDFAPTIQAANEGWANLVRVEGAAGKTGTTDGIFTAPQLNQAVRGADDSVRGRAMARGTALMQDLSNAGKSVLPSSVPDSGSAGRGLFGLMATGGVGSGLAHNPWPAVAAAAATIPYTPIGQRLAQRALTQRPSFAPTLADLLAKLRAPANVGGAALAVGAKNALSTPSSP